MSPGSYPQDLSGNEGISVSGQEPGDIRRGHIITQKFQRFDQSFITVR